jgi:hypothetical protein
MATKEDDVRGRSDDPLQATEYFWKVFVSSSYSSGNLEDLLSPDCRIQNQFGSQGKGLTGIKNCLQKLMEVQGRMKSSGLISTLPQGMALMRNQREVRFYLKGKVAFLTVVIGFALEWQSGIITGIVLMKDMDLDDFFVDNTIAPSPAGALADEPLPSPSPIQGQSQEVTLQDDITVKNTGEGLSGSSASAAPPVEPTGWYRGKYLGRKPPSMTKASPAPPPPPAAVPTSSSLTQQSLSPPYLCPRPPPIPPMLFFSLHSISHLKSQLTRLIERPVNSYVTFTVPGDSPPVSTPVIRGSSDPLFDPNQIFYLPLRPDYFLSNTSLTITVYDKHLLDDDVLATCHIPLVSLPAEKTNDQYTHLFIPLTQTASTGTASSTSGKRYGKIYRRIRGYDATKGVEGGGGGGEGGVGRRGSGGAGESVLMMKVCVLDVERWWYLEECQARDLQEMERIEREQIEREEEEARQKVQAEERAEAREKQIIERYRYGVKVGDVDWVDESKVHSCQR